MAVATEIKEMRAVYTEALIDLAKEDSRIVVLEADLMKATSTGSFGSVFPERTFNVGVAEANMIGVAAGLSAKGYIPFPATFCCFASRRAFDQFFISANYARLSVKLVGTDPGVSAAFNGGTHMSFEDIGLMRTIPKLVIVEPSDPVSLKALVREVARQEGCAYLRLHRKPIAPLYSENEPFQIGKGKVLREGQDGVIIALGAILVPEALKAANALEKEGVSVGVIDILTVKPLDSSLVLEWAERTGAVVTAENHQIRGGLGSAVAEVLAEHSGAVLRRVGVEDEFGEVGTQEYLQQRFGLTAERIVQAMKEAILQARRKKT
ncbi:MAG: transketolase C-terminal domain-containing protein [Spirochaetales bacterium]